MPVGLSRFHAEVVDHGDDVELALLVDGRDLAGRLDGIGMDPDEVLPGLRAGGRVQLARCGCGDDTCGEVAVDVRREGDEVVWDGFTSTLGEDLPGPLRFDAARYDRVLDRVEADRSWESPERRFAREANELVDDLLIDALAWRGLSWVGVEVAGQGTVVAHLTAEYGEDGPRWRVYVPWSLDAGPLGVGYHLLVGAPEEESDDPTMPGPVRFLRLLRRWGPTAWPGVLWWGDNEQAAFQQPPMAGRRWRMWIPPEAG